jgi:Pyruvate/2-oxoacid:ferredoxin oxidoreductase delta subunit
MSGSLILPRLLKLIFPYRYHLAHLTRLPLLGQVAYHIFFDHDHMVYLPKDRVIINQAIEKPGSFALPSQVVDHFIDQAKYHWIMNRCLCRDGDHCQNYPIDLGCLFLGQSVLKISPQLGRLVSPEEAHAHTRRARELGLVHLIGNDRIDSMWLGTRPSHKLLTICNCCPCCCAFRMIPQLSASISDRIQRMPGVSVYVDENCNGCGLCTRDVCFVNAIQKLNGKASVGEACRGCGRCVEICPRHAIHLEINDSSFLENTIQGIADHVDLS